MVRLSTCVLVRLLEVRVGSEYVAELYWADKEADRVGKSDKVKVYRLSEELVKDIRQRIRQTEGMRSEHETHLLFELGAVLGQIKEKYKRQVEIYRQIFNRYNKTTKFMSPEDGLNFRPLHYLIALEFITAKQLEIEQLVEICLRVPREELFVFTAPPQKVPKASSFPRMLRTPAMRGRARADDPAPEAVEQEFNRMAQEERLKMRLRAEYNKRHGKGRRKRK